jgi:hypothetical protein
MTRVWKESLVLLGSSMVFWALSSAVLAAEQFPQGTFSLLHYEGQSFHPDWSPEGRFPDVLSYDLKKVECDQLAHQTNMMLNNPLHELSKKLQIQFSPQVMVKPFIIFEELQDWFLAYQSSQDIREHTPIDEQFYLKMSLLSFSLDHIKGISNKQLKRLLSVYPYHNRVYGIHLQINW